MKEKNKLYFTASQVTQKIVVLLLLPSLGFLILLVQLYAYIHETQDDTAFINIASRQLMLSQEILSLTNMVAIGQKEDQFELQDAIKNFESGLQLLDKGGRISEDQHLHPAAKEIKTRINAVNEYWSKLRPSLQLVSKNPSYDNEFRNAVLTIKTDIGELTKASNDVIIAYDSRIFKLRQTMLYALLIAAFLGIGSIIIAVRVVKRFTDERDEIENKLTTSQERFSLAVNGSNDGIWDWDLDTGELYFSDRWKTMLSYRTDDLKNTFIAWRDLIHPDDLTEFLLSWTDYMEGKTKQFYIEYRLKTKNNDYKWIMCRGTSSTNTGTPTRLTGSHTDISLRKLQEQQLESERNEQAILINQLQTAQDDLSKSEEALRLSQVFSNIGSWDWNIETNKLEWSEIVRSMFGFTLNEGEVSYEMFINAIYPQDRSNVQQAIHNCLYKKMEYNIEHRVKWPDGTIRWLHERGDVIRDDKGDAIRMLGLVQDITEQKDSADDLHKLVEHSNKINNKLIQEQKERVASETKLTNILDIAPEAVIVIDNSQNITVFNKGAENIFGYQADEILGKSLDILVPDSVVGVHKQNVISFIDSADVHKDMGDRKEIFGKRKDGREFPCGASISKIKQNDEWICTVILRDLSEEIEVQNALLKEKHEQEQLIKQLQETQDQLLQSEKMASIGQLAAGVAHEINNPVGYINSNIGSLKNYINDLIKLLDIYEKSESVISDLTVIENIQTIKQEVEIDFLKDDVIDLIRESEEGVVRVKKIVQDLKEFSHVGEAEWQWANLHSGLDSTLNIVNNELKYKAEVIKEYGDLPDIECIVSQLNQVFMNILVNAAHAIETKGTITVRSGTENNGVWVEIEDTGKGMNEETKRRIFDPFYTTKPVGKGTGLGMSLSFNIIQKHNGTIDVKSKLGKGTCFHIWLPVNQVEQQAIS